MNCATDFPLPLREGGEGEGPGPTRPKPRRRSVSAATVRARALRKQSTKAEAALWFQLRRKQVHGLRFRRQFPLGPYFGDFVCLPARLVVEVDGSQHSDGEQAEHDRARTRWLERENFRVLRFWNCDVFNNIEGVLDRIEAAMREALPPTPSRKGRGR
jgi:very-short-patch-repair endonuclease